MILPNKPMSEWTSEEGKYWADTNIKAHEWLKKAIASLECVSNELLKAETTFVQKEDTQAQVHELRSMVHYMQGRLAAIQDMDEDQFDEILTKANDEWFKKEK